MTNNKQQTAVDSLKDFFKQYDLSHSSLDYYEFKIPMHIFDLKFQEAKEMEREQIIQAYSNAWHDGQDAIIMTIEHIDKGGDERGLKYYEQL